MVIGKCRIGNRDGTLVVDPSAATLRKCDTTHLHPLSQDRHLPLAHSKLPLVHACNADTCIPLPLLPLPQTLRPSCLPVRTTTLSSRICGLYCATCRCISPTCVRDPMVEREKQVLRTSALYARHLEVEGRKDSGGRGTQGGTQR